jgi:hypothetical protein
LRALSGWKGLAILAILLSPLMAPQLLAFPYVVQSNGDTVYSVAPIDRVALDRVTARANALVARSPLARPAEPRSIFLTDGGWRWSLLALGNSTTLALTRPVREAVIVGRSDVGADLVPTAFGTRRLSGIIAHEKCHGMERHHFGLTVDWAKPQWLREGYCDVVGAESTLSDDQARQLMASGQKPPALTYWQGRKRAETALAANGGNVDALFASAR